MSNNQGNKGRSSYLIQHRNKRLVARFYYYSHLLGLKFSRCLENLSLEFDLTESRICDLISEQSHLVSEMEIKEISLTELRKTYPFMVWNNPLSSSLRNVRQLSLPLFS